MKTTSASLTDEKMTTSSSGGITHHAIPLKLTSGPINVKDRPVNLVLDNDEAIWLALQLLGSIPVSHYETAAESVTKLEKFLKIAKMAKE